MHEGRLAAATSAWHRAIESFGRLEREYPGWNAMIVQLRLAEARNRLRQAETEPERIAAEAAEARMRLLLEELRGARAMLEDEPRVAGAHTDAAEIRKLKDALAESRRALATAEKEIRLLRSKMREAEAWRAQAETASTNLAYPEVILNEARRQMQDGRPEQAVQLLEEGLVLRPQDPAMTEWLGLALCQQGEYERAIRLLAPVARRWRRAGIWMGLGSAYMGRNEIGRARAAMEEAIKLAPASAEARYNMAQILMALSPPRAEAAEAEYRRALELGMARDERLELALRQALLQQHMELRRKKR